MSSPSYTLFLGDLSVYCTTHDLVQLFSPYGHVRDVRIIEDTKTGKKLSYGFVEYESIDSAINAMHSLNGCVVGGRHLRIQWGTDKTAKKPGKPKRQGYLPDLTSSVHVTFLSTMVNVIVSEDSLRSLFSAYGCVTDVAIKKLIHNSARNSNEGYAFVHFTNINQGMDSAVEAVTALDNVTVGGVHYRVSMSKTLERSLNTHMSGAAHPPPPPTVPYYANQAVYTPAPASSQLYMDGSPVAYAPPPSALPYYVSHPPAPPPMVAPMVTPSVPPVVAPVYPMAMNSFGYSRPVQHQRQTSVRNTRRLVSGSSFYSMSSSSSSSSSLVSGLKSSSSSLDMQYPLPAPHPADADVSPLATRKAVEAIALASSDTISAPGMVPVMPVSPANTLAVSVPLNTTDIQTQTTGTQDECGTELITSKSFGKK